MAGGAGAPAGSRPGRISDAVLGAPVGFGRTAEVYAWGEGRVLKLYRAGMPETWVHHEARVSRIVAGAGLQAPAIGDEVEVAGRHGIIYERIDGPSMLDGLTRRPATFFRVARQFAGLHAAMHGCARPELPSQRAGLIRAISNAPELEAAARARVLSALESLPDGRSVCHGDYHPDNIIMSQRGPLVIDWMTATHGSPVADVARTVLLFRFAVLPPGMPPAKRLMTTALRRAFLAAYLRSYRAERPCAAGDIQAWIPILAAARLVEGIAAEQEMLLRLANASA